ncbi:MAG: hypothetical protein AAGA96_16325 [Verrucomicrobiota bacterium]
MSYTKTKGIEFWYEFDQATNPGFGGVSQSTRDLYLQVFGSNFDMDGLVDAVRDSLYGADLGAYISGREQSFMDLAAFQVEIMERHFPDFADMQKAFEDFGHGVLHDNKKLPGTSHFRRPTGFMNHMMDGSPDRCVGYHRWHAFVRAAVHAGADTTKWLKINQGVGLAWAIYSELNPVSDSPANPKLDSSRVRQLRDFWMNADEATLNAGFLSYQGSFPIDYANRRAKGKDEIGFGRVQMILANATRGANPIHGGKGRFWELPLSEFVRTPIYNNMLIAPPGSARGNRSALVMALKGELPGFGQMPPFPRPPVATQDIAFIEAWIDDLTIA